MIIDNSLQTEMIRPLLLRVLKANLSHLPKTVLVGATKNNSTWFWENGIIVSRSVNNKSGGTYLGVTIDRDSDVTFTGFDGAYKNAFICEVSTRGRQYPNGELAIK